MGGVQILDILTITYIVEIIMKLSTRGRYGTRIMLELAKNYGQGPLSMAEISKNQDISVKYLEQLIIPLKKANLISSVRGPKGGQMLSKSPANINVWDVLIILESKFTIVACVGNEAVCEKSEDCPIRPIWGKAFDSIKRIFKETSLEDLLNSPGNH